MNRPATDAMLDQVAALQGRRHKFTLYAELDSAAPKDWLVEGLLGAGEQSAFYGKPGSGKSVLVGDLGLHVAAGRDWHGRKVKQGAVLYVALERCKLVERRTIGWRIHYGVNRLPFAIIGGVMDFRDARTADLVAGIVAEVEAETRDEMALIIVDTISRGLAGGDENSPRDMGAFVNTVGRIQTKTKAHVLAVHHTPQEGPERLRGHGALLGAMDSTVNVEKLTDGLRTATVVKANDSEEGEAISFTLESVVIGTDDEGQNTTAPVVVQADHVPNPKSRPKWSRGLRLIHDAITAAINDDAAIEYRVEADGPTVRAVYVADVRIYHRQHYVHGGDGSRDAAERQGWSRNLKEARKRGLIGSAVINDREIIWPA